MTTVDPFRVEIEDSAISDLKRRLGSARFPEKETVDDWSQGTPLAYVREVCDYWFRSYDMKRLEIRLNRYEQFRTEIDGVAIHFLHVRSRVDGAAPLILTHGWPGSVVEFLKVIQPLTNPEAHGGSPEDAFHLVIPALPGYGFSGKPEVAGWGVEKIADAWADLMKRLRYERYFAQGGDWGAAVTTAIGMRDTDHCMGIHVNMPIVRPDPETMSDLTDLEKSALEGLQYYQEWDSGYSKQQSTRPQSVGYGLVDSPVGQAAWILEKFWAWMDCDGHPENVLTRDELLDNIMMYWIPASGASSARLYWESFGSGSMEEVAVPSGCSIFPKEIFRASERWLRKRFTNLAYFNALDRGGHFAAFERPEAFVGEVRKCFRAIRSL